MVACNLPVFPVLAEIRHYHIIKWYKQPHMCNPTENHRESLGVYCWTIWRKPLKKKEAIWPLTSAHLFAYSENKNIVDFKLDQANEKMIKLHFSMNLWVPFSYSKKWRLLKIWQVLPNLVGKKKSSKFWSLSGHKIKCLLTAFRWARWEISWLWVIMHQPLALPATQSIST